MKKITWFIVLFTCCQNQNVKSAKDKGSRASVIPFNIQKLLSSYPGIIIGYSNNKLFFHDSSYLLYDDSQNHKTFSQLLKDPDIQDQFAFGYNKNMNTPTYQFDPGRIRNELFFKNIYGFTEKQVAKNLKLVRWCPRLINQKILMTHIAHVNEALQRVSNELDQFPSLKKYLSPLGGTFNWRFIKGTKRLSMHSFGIAIDLNPRFSNYWQNDCKCSDENASLHFKNKIPSIIIKVFEKNGFIWGGRWYHYDTMHFEYRPELL